MRAERVLRLGGVGAVPSHARVTEQGWQKIAGGDT